MKTIPPIDQNDPDKQAALDLIRSKLDTIYAEEPNAKEELAEAEAEQHRSKHQAYMHKLNQSGMSLAEIQTAWHKYYADLSDREKHEVWQEFYQEHDRTVPHSSHKPSDKTSSAAESKAPAPKSDPRSIAEVKRSITRTARHSQRRKLSKREHLKSLLFGLSAGAVVVVIFMFGLFNERFIAPFITPSKTVSNSSIIIDPSSTTAGPEPKLIIPKINAELPVIYDQTAIDEASIQDALEKGVVHYSTTSMPGELGNGAIFGHSSNNILNKGKYKFAFVLLRKLEVGDTFILQKDSKRYVYKVINKKVVPPSQVSVLNETYGKPATFTLITCDPPGTSTNRLVVTGEQITPDPSQNKASTAETTAEQPAELPSNSPSLWSRIVGWLF
ncbi:sortase [Candidatus Saccharibacteria bacterium]|nr:sortase [Candidatus Saccharibacteria bacterium]